MALTDKQQRFVDEYLVDLNATQAAVRAGYSENTARSIGSENLSKPDIQEAIAARRLAIQRETGITVASVLEGLYREATREGEGTSHAARVSAWSWLGKHFGAWVERVEHGGEIKTGRDMSDEELQNRISAFMPQHSTNGNGSHG